jgi:hypothetical protein
VGFIALVALEDLGMELTFPISGHFDLLESTRRGDQITPVEAVAIPFAFGATFSPSHADDRIKLLAHDVLHHHTHSLAGQFA